MPSDALAKLTLLQALWARVAAAEKALPANPRDEDEEAWVRRLAHLSDLHFGRVDPAAADPIVPAGNAARLAAMLTEAGAVVRHETVPAGHGLSQADLAITKDWFGRLQ